MNQPLIEPNAQKAEPAKRFAAMAQRIDDNIGEPFGGAVVIVPPGGGESIEILMLDPHADLAMFWSAISTKIGIALQALEAEKRQRGGFGR